uniref:ECF sigma factor n=1 Tax=Siphoviridae sp. cty3u30 TaxID=2825744 RepID=A0A8S5Q7Z6_9CAUD|nr:MAG TPA: ECF sigma factor [Siphoviridae sp. cty3u30]
MNKQHRELRARISTMAPKRAVAYILSFELPDDEAACLIECDVRRRSYAQVCALLHLSPEAVNRCRRRAYQKIIDGQGEYRG